MRRVMVVLMTVTPVGCPVTGWVSEMKGSREMAKKVITVKDPALAAAEKAWAKVLSGLLNAEEGILDIIRGRLWEAEGYESFDKAWIDKLSDIRLSHACSLAHHRAYMRYRAGKCLT